MKDPHRHLYRIEDRLLLLADENLKARRRQIGEQLDQRKIDESAAYRLCDEARDHAVTSLLMRIASELDEPLSTPGTGEFTRTVKVLRKAIARLAVLEACWEPDSEDRSFFR